MSRDLFDMFASNPKNGLIIADFAVQGTMARSVLDSPADVLTRDGRTVRHPRAQPGRPPPAGRGALPGRGHTSRCFACLRERDPAPATFSQSR